MRLIILAILTGYFFINSNCLSQNTRTIYFVYLDSKSDKKEILDKTNFIIEHTNAKKIKCEIIHYTSGNVDSESWTTKKNTFKYNSSLIDCSFDLCSKLGTILSFTKTSESRFFYVNPQLDCSESVKREKLNNDNESTIISQINNELQRLKEFNGAQTLYFVFNKEDKPIKPKIEFEKEVFDIKESVPFTLIPKFSGNISSYDWSPKSGLSCTDCPSPTLTLKESTKYTLTVRDSSGCNTISASININVEKACKCNTGISKVEIPFKDKRIKKIEKRDINLTADWDYRILSYQSGGFLFDIITKSSCAEKYNFKLIGKNGVELINDDFLLEQIDERSNSDYHDNPEFQDYFVFRIDLTDIHEIIENPKNYFIVEIIPYDNSNELCNIKKYSSPKLRLTKCN
jgi:hypothetical protein